MKRQAVRRVDYEKELRRRGVRITRPRRIILGILSETEDHPDALEIFRRAVAVDSSISLSTVYRTMKLLGDLGAIHRHAFEGGPSRFEHATGDHHDHLIDVETGKPVMRSVARSRTSYNRVESEFANITAARDAEARVARDVAADIKLQLGVHFSSQPRVADAAL